MSEWPSSDLRKVVRVRPRIAIIGAGVAGSSCAIRLSRYDLDITLLEKETFPRDKVCGCCLGPDGVAALDQLALSSWLQQSGMPLNRWTSSMAGRLVNIPLAGGVAISRTVLDAQLCQVAREHGVAVRMGCRVRSIHQDDSQVKLSLNADQRETEEAFAAVVVATGLTGLGTRSLPSWKEPPHGPFGVSWNARCDAAKAGVIYMACDDAGYVGMVKLSDGRVDIAGALRSQAEPNGFNPQQRAKAILQRSRFAEWGFSEESTAMTTPPLRRCRPSGDARMLLIGDAAGYVEPFTGEGMTWAARSGIAAADTIAESIDCLQQVGDRWSRQTRKLLRSKKLRCSLMTAALRNARVRKLAAVSLARWPGLAKPFTQRL